MSINDGRERQVSAIRVVAAASLGRPIEQDEDVHHTCQTPRCVEETHLAVLPYQVHSDHHAEHLEQSRCSVHDRPYDRRDPERGWGVCVECRREAVRRWAARNPEKLRNRTFSETTIQKRRTSEKAHRSTPEYKAKAAAYQRNRRARLKAQAPEQQES